MSPQKRATIISTLVATLLLLVKLILALLSGSVALLASAVDSLLDMLVSLFNFFAIKKAEECPDDVYQYGKGKIQAIAGVIEGTLISLSGLFIMYEATIKFNSKESTTLLLPSIIGMVFSIIITYFLVRYLLKVAEETDNIVIKADALHYQTDLWSNAVVLLSLGLVYFTKLDVIDAILGFGIGIYIIYSAIEIIRESIEILLDKALDSKIISSIGEIISSHSEVSSYHWLKTRTDGSINFVEFHLVLRPNMILREAHRIADEIEDKIFLLDKKNRWIITPHFDPHDDEQLNNKMLNANCNL